MSLSSHLVIRKSLLVDQTVGASHHVSPGGKALIGALRRGILYRDLLLLAEKNALPTTTVTDMLGFINLTGSLHLRRRSMAKITALRLRLLGYCTGVQFAPLAWRQSLSLGVILQGLLRASWLVLATGIAVAAIAIGSGLVGLQTGTYLLVSSSAVFFASIYFHEYGHASRLHSLGVACDVLQRGLRFGLLHRRMEPRAEITVALAGPVWGFGICGGGALIGVLRGEQFLAGVSLVVSLIHILSFLPWYGDGASIRYALGKRSET